MVATAPTPTKRYTIYDLDQFPDDGKLRELVDGRIVEWDMPNFDHGLLLAALTSMLRIFASQHRLGVVVAGDTMVRISGSVHHARGADIAFYARGRIPQDGSAPATVVAPDFVVELISPSDREKDVQEKVKDWLRIGVRLLWYVNSETGLTTTYDGGRVTHVEADETLTGGDVLPGFTLRMRDVLDEIAALSEPEA